MRNFISTDPECVCAHNDCINGLHEGEYIVTEPLINATENTKVQILGKENQKEEEITETQANKK